jgi:hypothetical protein
LPRWKVVQLGSTDLSTASSRPEPPSPAEGRISHHSKSDAKMRPRSLAPLVKARGFGMTPFGCNREPQQSQNGKSTAPDGAISLCRHFGNGNQPLSHQLYTRFTVFLRLFRAFAERKITTGCSVPAGTPSVNPTASCGASPVSAGLPRTRRS